MEMIRAEDEIVGWPQGTSQNLKAYCSLIQDL
jgi:hypothetical protein